MNIFPEAKIHNISRSLASFLLSACCVLGLAGCVTTPYVVGNATSKFTTEADIVRTLGYQAAGSDVQGFPSVFPSEEINVRVYRDVDEPLASYKTFDFDYTDRTNPLLEKELFRQLEKVLQAHGLTRVKENPQVVISMNFFIGKKEQYTPPATVTSTEIKYVWNTGMIGWNVGGYTSAVPVTSSTTTSGYTTTTYYSNIRLNFLNHAKLVGGKKLETPPLIWLGEADHSGSDSDIRGAALIMFGELMKEFPGQSVKAPKRYVRLFRYGGLGLGFAPTDWRLISYVEPSSVAAENGIKSGDFLLEINGENAFNWPFFYANLYRPPDPTAYYRSKDPYFRYILSNKGDSDVNIVIKSAETGKRVMLRMRPRSDDRYLYVDQNGISLQ